MTTLEPLTELSARRLGPMRRFFFGHPVVMDVMVAGLFCSSIVTDILYSSSLPEGQSGDTTPSQLAMRVVALTIAGAVALMWRRRSPLLVSMVMGALALACLALVGTFASIDLGLAFTTYAVAASRPPKTAWLTFLALSVVCDLGIVHWDRGVVVGSITTLLVFMLTGQAIGTSVRNRRMHVAEIVERTIALSRDRDQQAQLARAAERSRIAREMHDVVAHSLSVMIALADGATAAMQRSPEGAQMALGELSTTGRASLADMRRMLGVLDGTDAPLEPQPGSPDLSDLVDRFRAAGLTVHAKGIETQLPKDAGLQLTVYRIVQEALTNVLRHAPGTLGTDLSVTCTREVVTVEVTDHGPTIPAPDPSGAGRGIVGMRERVSVYGGTIETGPWRDGWRVLAVLPWRKDKS